MQRRAALPVPISVMVTTLWLVYCTLFRVNPIPVVHDRYSGCKRCEIGGLWLCMTLDMLDMVISPVYTAALNQFKMALEPARGYTTDFSAHNLCSYQGMVRLSPPCSSTMCVSEMFTPAVVMPLAALQLPLTITA